MEGVLTARPSSVNDFIFALVRESFPGDVDEILSKFNQQKRDKNHANPGLEKIWYASLLQDKPAYDIYESTDYISEALMCWQVCSRRYVQWIRSYVKDAKELSSVRGVLDVGCGLGLSTAALVEVFPHALVYATQLKDCPQWEIASRLAKKFNFELRCPKTAIGEKIDLVFASEYFEHFLDPLLELESLLFAYMPTFLIFANSFTSKSAGHFDRYDLNGLVVDGKTANKLFTRCLSRHQYQKIAGGWNIWQHKGKWRAAKHLSN